MVIAASLLVRDKPRRIAIDDAEPREATEIAS
jgi:hypothetical protein